MRMLPSLVALALAVACAASTVAPLALPGDASAATPSRLGTPRAVFSIARLKYGGGGDWYGDQSSLKNLLAGLRDRAGVPVGSADGEVVTPTDESLFNHPMLFMSGHGNVKFTPAETERLRRYLTGGGFLWCDDDYGISDSFRREIKRVLPDAELVELPFSHPIFHQQYSFARGLPKIHEHSGGAAKAFGAHHDGRLVALFTFETDIGDGLEDEGIHDDTPAKREDAMRMAVNIALFALSQ